MSRRLLNVGEQFEALRTAACGDVTVGKIYTIAGKDLDGDIYFIDDAGDKNFACASGGNLRSTGYKVINPQ